MGVTGKRRVISSQEKGRRALAKWWRENPIEPIRQAWLALRPPEGFGLIMVDLPWPFSGNSKKKPGRNARRHYETAPLEWLKALPIRELAAPDCIFWVWTTNPLLRRAFEVLDAWGVRHSTGGHWTKVTKAGKPHMGGGLVLRGSGEPYLIGRQGRPLTTKGVPGSFMAPRREHSRKPDLAFELAEQLMPGVFRIEVFAREARSGWAIWGNETEKFTKGDTHDETEAETRSGGRRHQPGGAGLQIRPGRAPGAPHRGPDGRFAAQPPAE